MNSLIY